MNIELTTRTITKTIEETIDEVSVDLNIELQQINDLISDYHDALLRWDASLPPKGNRPSRAREAITNKVALVIRQAVQETVDLHDNK
jgi:hypothetical protein